MFQQTPDQKQIVTFIEQAMHNHLVALGINVLNSRIYKANPKSRQQCNEEYKNGVEIYRILTGNDPHPGINLTD